MNHIKEGGYLWNYVTPVVAYLLVSYIVSIACGPAVLRFLRRIKFGQNINEDAPSSHQKKQGTPSSGGVLMCLGVTVGIAYPIISGIIRDLNAHDIVSPYSSTDVVKVEHFEYIPRALVAIYLVFLAHASLGFLDDTLKAKRGKNLGLKTREKLAIQFVISGAFVLWLMLNFHDVAATSVELLLGHVLNLGWFYYLFAFVLMVGLSNATNLSDGLDGLATGLSISAAIGIAVSLILLVITTSWPMPLSAMRTVAHLRATYSSGAIIFSAALIGACLGFLWFNAHPAKVFMGDTGSLALGGSFAAMGILSKIELPLLIIMLVFLAEAMSVLIQVGYFKWTARKGPGKRVFKMAPIHHHFELLGWPETQVVARFCIIGSLAAIVGVAYASCF